MPHSVSIPVANPATCIMQLYSISQALPWMKSGACSGRCQTAYGHQVLKHHRVNLCLHNSETHGDTTESIVKASPCTIGSRQCCNKKSEGHSQPLNTIGANVYVRKPMIHLMPLLDLEQQLLLLRLAPEQLLVRLALAQLLLRLEVLPAATRRLLLELELIRRLQGTLPSLSGGS